MPLNNYQNAVEMNEDTLKEPKQECQEEETPKKIDLKSSRKLHEYEDNSDAEASSKERRIKATLLSINKPSYCLKKGIGSSQRSGKSLRSYHRKMLWRILKEYMRRHNWAEASGVLSVLLQATVEDHSLSGNRAKYSAALELLTHMKGETLSSRKIQSVYELWMKKIGPLKYWSTKERFAVQLEYIITCLQLGNTEDAYQASLLLMQECDFGTASVANMVVGLVFFQMWYCSIPKELQLTELDSAASYMQSENPVDGIHMHFDYSIENDAFEELGANSPIRSDSSTSVAHDKVILDGDGNQQKESMDVDENVKKEATSTSFEQKEFYIQSAEEYGHNDNSFSNYSGDHPHASIFYTQGLPPWLLPMKLPSSHENLDDAMRMHKRLHNNHYKSALKHLRIALDSKPPVIEAFHPLIQTLLLGDQVHEALDIVETLCHSSAMPFQLRVKATLLEHFDSGNYVKLCTCFEDILNKDPTCSNSVEKLVLMHRRGYYDTQNLVEMIALHLDVSNGICDTWQELASCLLKLCQSEGDRMSTCGGGGDRFSQGYLDNSDRVPELFTNGKSADWRYRCECWLTRHFNEKIVVSDIASDDLKLLTYKAAVASHLYGREFRYVLKATQCLEEQNDMDLYSFLQTHILNSVGFYSC